MLYVTPPMPFPMVHTTTTPDCCDPGPKYISAYAAASLEGRLRIKFDCGYEYNSQPVYRACLLQQMRPISRDDSGLSWVFSNDFVTFWTRHYSLKRVMSDTRNLIVASNAESKRGQPWVKLQRPTSLCIMVHTVPRESGIIPSSVFGVAWLPTTRGKTPLHFPA